MQDKIQSLAVLMKETIGLEVTVVDSTLRRIAGTGVFSTEINLNSPHNSIFQEVIKSKKKVINYNKENNPICINCNKYDSCSEKENISYPIIVKDTCIGVVSVACLSDTKKEILNQREKEVLSLMSYMTNVIENEVLNIEQHNKIITKHAEINEIINCIDKGILIIDSSNIIVHINSSAIAFLHFSFSEEAIIGQLLEKLVTGLNYGVPENFESADCWKTKQNKYRVLYKINRLLVDDETVYRIITFETIDEIVQKALMYKEKQRINFSSIIGTSKVLQEAVKIAKKTAGSDSTILLYGESGTGKELFARSIHNESYRKEGPYIAINCACMPENLIEAELFGYEKGAFTGANTKGRAGKFEAAEGGTIFLDEIGEIPLHLQGKLLRVLQERQIERIGCNETKPVNIRIIAASNKDLKLMVEEKLFRKDLYYRINVIPINLPPLRDRGEDIKELALYILHSLCNKMNTRMLNLDSSALELFMDYHWPGNIREMENILEYAVNFCNGPLIKRDHLPAYIIEETNQELLLAGRQEECLKGKIETISKEIIQKHLEKYGSSTTSKRMIAKELNISLSTLYRKLQS
ncbi:MAG: AAA family ATPase [Spirochaetia bacterium]|nr:AAA family ATPase [Spirochaetia bacterium]